MCFGHTHKTYHRIINNGSDGSDRFRHAINRGSVGKPKDGYPRGGYVLLSINENSPVSDKNSITVEFVRFEYEVKKAATAVENSPLPNAYTENLRKGIQV